MKKNILLTLWSLGLCSHASLDPAYQNNLLFALSCSAWCHLPSGNRVPLSTFASSKKDAEKKMKRECEATGGVRLSDVACH